ncbi:unnamed protein product, partial [Ixodes hexagonus]
PRGHPKSCLLSSLHSPITRWELWTSEVIDDDVKLHRQLLHAQVSQVVLPWFGVSELFLGDLLFLFTGRRRLPFWGRGRRVRMEPCQVVCLRSRKQTPAGFIYNVRSVACRGVALFVVFHCL